MAHRNREERELLERATDLRTLIATSDTPREREKFRCRLATVERRLARIAAEKRARRAQREAEIAERRREAESAHLAQQEAAETEAQQAARARENDAWVRRNFPAADAPRRIQRKQGSRVVQIGNEEITIDD